MLDMDLLALLRNHLGAVDGGLLNDFVPWPWAYHGHIMGIDYPSRAAMEKIRTPTGLDGRSNLRSVSAMDGSRCSGSSKLSSSSVSYPKISSL